MSQLKRTEVGNTATETGAFENGADPNAINQSSVPHSRPAIEVSAKIVNGDIVITPEDGGPGALMSPQTAYRFMQGVGELQEGPRDILDAQLLDEPDEVGTELRRVNGVEIEARPWRFEEISTRTPREQLVWYGYSPDGLLAVLGDHVAILKDVLESAYSCKPCRGKGFMTTQACGNCRGEKYEVVGDQRRPCRACRVLGFQMEQTHSCGCRLCDACNGSGWDRGIVIPEIAQQEAITGIAVSVGPECRLLKIGDRVVHSRYAGHTLKMAEDYSIVTMRECEVLQILRQR